MSRPSSITRTPALTARERSSTRSRLCPTTGGPPSWRRPWRTSPVSTGGMLEMTARRWSGGLICGRRLRFASALALAALAAAAGAACGSSNGTWYVTTIDAADWSRWGVEEYGPQRKVVLEGWNDDFGDGPIEDSEAGVDFLWVIYRVDDPSPGVVQMKFGHP